MANQKIDRGGYQSNGTPSDNKRTSEDLSILQGLDLDLKIAISKRRIEDWYEEFDGDVYVSFSGGKDSTVLLHLVRSMYPDVPGVFADTGLEYPELRNFVKTIPNIVWIKPDMNFKKVIEIYGYPIISKEQAAYIQEYRDSKSDKLKNIRWNGNKYGQGKISEKWKYLVDAPFKISDKCCDIMKKKPMYKYEKETGRKPIIGTMACESSQRKTNWIREGCNAFNAKRPTSKPLSFWTEQDILSYIKKYNLSYASVYGEIKEDECGKLYTTKCDRTGCVFCGFGCTREKEQNRFQRLKITHPKLWEYCMKSTEEGGLGMKVILDYIGVPID